MEKIEEKRKQYLNIFYEQDVPKSITKFKMQLRNSNIKINLDNCLVPIYKLTENGFEWKEEIYNHFLDRDIRLWHFIPGSQEYLVMMEAQRRHLKWKCIEKKRKENIKNKMTGVQESLFCIYWPLITVTDDEDPILDKNIYKKVDLIISIIPHLLIEATKSAEEDCEMHIYTLIDGIDYEIDHELESKLILWGDEHPCSYLCPEKEDLEWLDSTINSLLPDKYKRQKLRPCQLRQTARLLYEKIINNSYIPCEPIVYKENNYYYMFLIWEIFTQSYVTPEDFPYRWREKK